MLDLYTPQFEDLWFRKLFMSDEATMSYNHNCGGTIDFPESKWQGWYERWIENAGDKKHGIEELYDDIAIDNPAVNLFLQMGFVEEYRTPEIIMVKKRLFHM